VYRKEQDGVTRVHQPHPNIIDALRGTLRTVDRSSSGAATTSANGDAAYDDVTADDNSDDENDATIASPISMDQISEEFRLPAELLEQHKMASK